MGTPVEHPALSRGVAVTILVLGAMLAVSPLRAAGRSTAPSHARLPAFASGPPYWLPVASMHGPRTYLAAAVGLDGRIYALGGTGSQGLILATAEVYTPGANTWQLVAPLAQAREGMVAATGPDGHIYVIDGQDSAGGVSTVEAYLPAQNRWVPRASPTSDYTFGAATRGPDGRVYAINADGMEAYDTRQQQWMQAPDPLTPRTHLGAATGSDGRIYTVGGIIEPGCTVPTVEAYDVAASTWASLAPLPLERQDLGVAAGPDGRIYALGGARCGGVEGAPSLSVVDAYDPQAKRWQAVAPLGTPRQGLAAVRGADGRIYALGGSGPTSNLATVEAYGPLIHLAPPNASAGSTMVLTGTNFAAHATVRVTWGSTPGGTLLGIGHTDRAGNLPHPLRFRLPASVRPGYYRITAEDTRSRYPVTAVWNVRRPALQ